MTCFSILNCALTRLRNQVEKCGISEIVIKQLNELNYNGIVIWNQNKLFRNFVPNEVYKNVHYIKVNRDLNFYHCVIILNHFFIFFVIKLNWYSTFCWNKRHIRRYFYPWKKKSWKVDYLSKYTLPLNTYYYYTLNLMFFFLLRIFS